MKIYTTKLSEYKMLDRLSSEIISATLENDTSYIRIYLDKWDWLNEYDIRIEILRPDNKKYISSSLNILNINENGVDRKYIEVPIVLIMCELKGLYYLDLCCTQQDKVFKSLNQITYKVNESINAFDSMDVDDINLVKNVFSADEQTLSLSNDCTFSINEDWIDFNVSQPLQDLSQELDHIYDEIHDIAPNGSFTKEDKEKLDSLENYDDTEIKNRINVIEKSQEEVEHSISVLQNDTISKRLTLLPDLPSKVNINKTYIYVDNDGKDNRISIRNLITKTIRTESSIPNDLEIGGYLFLEKGEN